MKFTLLSAAGVLSAIAQVSAVTIVTPWANSVWTAGGHGNITWTTTAADAGLKCDIYLLNGQGANSNIVAQVTDPSTPVDCSAGAYDIYPLNDFVSGSYWIRVGQSATNTWAYSGVFSFVGNGTSSPISLASSATSAAAATGTAAAASSANAAVTTGLPATTIKASASVSGSAKPTSSTSGASSMSISSAAVALGAIAAIAFNL